MTSILRQILDFARRRGPNRSEQTLGALIERVRGLLAPLARRSGVQLEVMPSSTPVVARVDPAQIEQAVTNLVMNAVAASREGSEVVLAVDRVEARPPADKGSATAPRWCARLRVIDHGAGISPENLERVLEPFFTTKPVGEGTGLGLSVTQGIVQEHDGWIDIESRLGVGSTFSLFIPID
jgi:signal transduction histidine kinase